MPRKQSSEKPKIKESHSVFIYGLTDPRTGHVAYVGKAVDPQKRYLQHILGREDQKTTPKSAWIKHLLAMGEKPGLTIIEECTQDNWKDRERHHIAEHRAKNASLKNLADGGNAPSMTLEQRREAAKKLNGGLDKPINRLVRYLSIIRGQREKKGDIEGAEVFAAVMHIVSTSTGALRDRYREYAKEKLQVA